MYHLRLDDNLSITDELSDAGAGVGSFNLGLLRRVEPYLAFTNPRNGGGETFLHTKIHYIERVLVLGGDSNWNRC